MSRPAWLHKPAWLRKPHLNPSAEARVRRVALFAVVCLLTAASFAGALVYTRGKVSCLQDQLQARNAPTAELAAADQVLATASVKYFLSNLIYVQAQAAAQAALTAVLVAPKSQQVSLFRAFTTAQQAYSAATTHQASAAQKIVDAETAWKAVVINVQHERLANPLGSC